jgi:pheromone shutdown protein TraB
MPADAISVVVVVIRTIIMAMTIIVMAITTWAMYTPIISNWMIINSTIMAVTIGSASAVMGFSLF